jgi:RimJ/RimL family protein N-acetyltransferase
VDVTDRNVVKQRIKLIETGKINRIIALKDDEIVADGALELFDDEWRKHQGELRTIVAHSFQRKGLGMLLMREIYFIAVQKKVEKLIARIMRPQKAALKICRRLGFHKEGVLHHYLRDRDHTEQDMIIMSCDMKEFWKELEHFYMDSDWQKRR